MCTPRQSKSRFFKAKLEIWTVGVVNLVVVACVLMATTKKMSSTFWRGGGCTPPRKSWLRLWVSHAVTVCFTMLFAGSNLTRRRAIIRETCCTLIISPFFQPFRRTFRVAIPLCLLPDCIHNRHTIRPLATGCMLLQLSRPAYFSSLASTNTAVFKVFFARRLQIFTLYPVTGWLITVMYRGSFAVINMRG